MVLTTRLRIVALIIGAGRMESYLACTLDSIYNNYNICTFVLCLVSEGGLDQKPAECTWVGRTSRYLVGDVSKFWSFQTGSSNWRERARVSTFLSISWCVTQTAYFHGGPGVRLRMSFWPINQLIKIVSI